MNLAKDLRKNMKPIGQVLCDEIRSILGASSHDNFHSTSIILLTDADSEDTKDQLPKVFIGEVNPNLIIHWLREEGLTVVTVGPDPRVFTKPNKIQIRVSWT